MTQSSPFQELNPPSTPSGSAGPFAATLFAAPGGTTTYVLPPPEVVAVARLLQQIDAKTKAYNLLADKVAEGTQELTRVRAAIRALAVLADTMATRGPLNPSTYDPKIEIFQSTTKNLLDRYFKAPAFGASLDVRAIDSALGDAVTATRAELLDLLKSPASIATFRAWTNLVDWEGDWSAAPAAGKLSGITFTAEMMLGVDPIHAAALSALRRLESEKDILDMAESLASAAESGPNQGPLESVLHVTVNSCAAIFQKVASGTAGMATQAVGPDGLYLRVLETYALKFLPKAAVSKAEALRLRGFLLKNLTKATGCTSKSDLDALRGRYVKVATAQRTLAGARSHLEKVDLGDAEKLAKFEGALAEARTALEAAEQDLATHLSPHEKIAKTLTQGTIPWKSAMAILGVVQLCDAFSGYSGVGDPLDAAKQTADLAAAAVQTASLSLDIGVGLLKKAIDGAPSIRASHAQMTLSVLAPEVEKFAVLASVGAAVLSLISGGLQVLQGIRDRSFLKGLEGGLQALSGGAQVYGLSKNIAAKAVVEEARAAQMGIDLAVGESLALTGDAALLMVVGDALCILAVTIALGEVAYKETRTGTQKVSGAIFDYIVNQKWGYGQPQNFVTKLGLASLASDAQNSIKAIQFYDIPLDPSPSNDRLLERKYVIEQLKAAGLSAVMADMVVEAP